MAHLSFRRVSIMILIMSYILLINYGKSFGKSTATPQLAVVSNRDGNKEIYLVSADGSSKVNLTNNPAEDFMPSWSPDGNTLYFISDRNQIPTLYSMNSDGSNVKELPIRVNTIPICDNYCRHVFLRPMLSPDGLRVAFTPYFPKDAGWLDLALVTISKIDGTDRIKLPNFDGPSINVNWSPNSKWVAIETYDTMNYTGKLWVVDKDGKGRKLIAQATPKYVDESMRYSITLNSWSSDSRFISFYANAQAVLLGENRIGIVSPNVKSSDSWLDIDRGRFSAWSPNGSRLAYFAESDPTGATTSTTGLLIYQVEDRTKTFISDKIGITEPAWSPDGAQIAFIEETSDGSGNFILISTDGKSESILNLPELPAGIGAYNLPRPIVKWSPDSSYVITYQDGESAQYQKNIGYKVLHATGNLSIVDKLGLNLRILDENAVEAVWRPATS